jgi:hypothetical protein
MKTKLFLLAIWMISLKNFAQNTYSTIGVGYLQNQPQIQLNPLDWHYIAVTKSGLNGNVYIDGVLASSSTYSNVPYIWNSLLLGATQGCVSCSPVPTYLGMIDEVRISNTVRTASEIQNNFNGNSPFTSDANTLGLFHFDSNTGTTITNSAGSNNGVLYGGVSFDNGKFGLGLSFDGIDDYSRISQSIPVDNMTVEFWYKSSDDDAVLAMMEYAYNTGIYLGTSSISCEVPTGSLANGLVAYYPFCGNANDISGNGNNGIVNGATLTTDRYGISNSAYDFSQSGQYINIGNNPSLNHQNSNFSISAWINISQYSNFSYSNTIISNRSMDNKGSIFGIVGTINSADLGKLQFGCGGGANAQSLISSNVIPTNEWVNVVVTYSYQGNNNNLVKLYINGILNASGTLINTPGPILENNSIGDEPLDPANQNFTGKIDDISFWDRELTLQEVQILNNINPSNSCDIPSGSLANGMVAYYPFCGNANDGSVNANNGIVSGATLTSDRYGNANSAYSFNGSSNYIQVPNSTSLQNINEVSISAWIDINTWYQSGGNGYFPILHKSDQQGQYGKYALTIKDNGGISHLGSQENGFSFPSWNLNSWQHVVLVISNNTNKIYIDGNLVSEAPSGVFPNSFNETLPLIIGMDKPGLIEYANGKIDDIGIWNRALSQQEITNLYNNNLSTNLVINSEIKISIYPNPTNSLINIDSSNMPDILGSDIKINNILGQEIYHSKLNEQVEKISLGSIASSGLYIIHITDRNGKTIATNKVILQ